MRAAVFLDRDGVINVDHGFVHRIEDFEFVPRVHDALKIIREHGYLLILITNQAGVAYGMYTEDDVKILHDWMQRELDKEGLAFDGIYYCPHHPENGVNQYLCDCDCRKPKTGLIRKALADFDIDLKNSYMVGDRPSDIRTGINAGLKGSYLVRTGKPITDEGQNLADQVFSDLFEFAQQIIMSK